MKLKEARAAYDRFGGKASDIARQLSFAGLALVWVLAMQGEEGATLPGRLLLPTGLIVGSLAFDLLQHLYGTLAWGVFHRCKERKGVTEEKEFLAPRQINWPTNTFFWLKQLFILVAYILLFRHLLVQLF